MAKNTPSTSKLSLLFIITEVNLLLFWLYLVILLLYSTLIFLVLFTLSIKYLSEVNLSLRWIIITSLHIFDRYNGIEYLQDIEDFVKELKKEVSGGKDEIRK